MIFFRAQTTARTQNRQESVLKSKYPIYSLSIGTKKQVMSARINAIVITVFRFINLIMLLEIVLTMIIFLEIFYNIIIHLKGNFVKHIHNFLMLIPLIFAFSISIRFVCGYLPVGGG